MIRACYWHEGVCGEERWCDVHSTNNAGEIIWKVIRMTDMRSVWNKLKELMQRAGPPAFILFSIGLLVLLGFQTYKYGVECNKKKDCNVYLDPLLHALYPLSFYIYGIDCARRYINRNKAKQVVYSIFILLSFLSMTIDEHKCHCFKHTWWGPPLCLWWTPATSP